MRKPINPNKTPVGGWSFIDPDTGHTFSRKYSSLDDLIKEVVKYRDHNRLQPISNLKDLIYNHVCEKDGMQVNCCEVRNKKRSLDQYTRGGYSYIKASKQGSNAFVSQELADARAEICLNCPLMKIPKKTSALEKFTNEKMERLVGKRVVAKFKELFTCDVCSCLVRAKVWFNRTIVNDSLSNEEKMALPKDAFGKDGKKFTCWQLLEAKIQPKVEYKNERIKRIEEARKKNGQG